MFKASFDLGIIADIRSDQARRQKAFFQANAEGVHGLLVQEYERVVYGGNPLGVFGYPRDESAALGRSMVVEHSDKESNVHSTHPEAVFVEFGTGIYSEIGGKAFITPKNSRFLVFPVWQLPPDFKGIFVSRDEEDFNFQLPAGAIGVVMTRKVAGMKARHVWFSPRMQSLVARLIKINEETFL